MKRTYITSFAFMLISIFFSVNNAISQVCCPGFELKDAVEICPPEGACKSDDPIGGQGNRFVACKESAHTYTVYPNDPGYTYTWTVTGGNPTTFIGNPNTIVWGSGNTGFIKVVISNLASGGNCVDSLMQYVCLIDGPEADFSLSPDTVCQNTPVHFSNTSMGGSSYYWDFGDGTNYNGANPPDHAYASPGTYTVTLTVQDMGAGQIVITQEPPSEVRVPCGCIDTISKTVVVLPGQGPEIVTDCCYGTVCPGDTSSFCSGVTCSVYDWSVTGGTFIGDSTASCVKVKWNSTYSGPTTVSLAVPGCGSAPCDGTTTLDVPVLYPNLPISGPTILCEGASASYSLPVLPGTYYKWTTSGGYATFNNVDRNSALVNITFLFQGTYWVKCEYDNPLAGCSGVDSLQVDVRPEFFFSGKEVVCENDTTSYYANGAATWSVSPSGPVFTAPNGAISMDVAWPVGTYTLTAVPVNPNSFCNSSAFKNIEVKAKPVLNNIAGPDSVCPGTNLTYQISSNLSGSPFIWSITGGTGSIQSEMGDDKDSVVVMWAGSGPWQLSVYQAFELSPGDTCESLVKSLDIYPYQPPVLAGSDTVCVDYEEYYTAGGSSLLDYQWSISPSSQGTIQSGQGTGTVSILWHGPPATATLSVTTCAGTDQIAVTIVNPPAKPVISANGPTQYCTPNMPSGLILSVPSGYTSYQWFDSGGAISGANSASYSVPNSFFTGDGAYVFLVEVSNGQCSVVNNIVILIGDCGGGGNPPNPIPCTIDFTMNPDPACVGQPVTFTAVPPAAGFTYAWDFGDSHTSFKSPTQHAYNAPGTYTVTLTATLGSICVADTMKNITVNPLPSCSITSPDTIFCQGDSLPLTACSGMSSYQWFRNGSAITGATASTYYAHQQGDYKVGVTNGFGCMNFSNSIYLYLHTPPTAKITGDKLVCGDVSNPVQVNMSTVYNTNYSYSWSSIPGGATFSPPTAYYTSATLSITSYPAVYEFVVEVTDNLTLCKTSDTLCVYFFENPPLSVPYLNVCEGDPYVLTPTPNDPANYIYQWNNGATTPVITAMAPGYYSLTITDKGSGCSTTQPAGFIHPKPDLRLFPLGCDHICTNDTFHMYIPLPLEQFHTFVDDYNFATWYADGDFGTPIGSGTNLAWTGGSAGNHQLSVVVQNKFFCSDTAGVFCLSVDTTITFMVSTETPCGCDTSLIVEVIDHATNEVVKSFTINDCLDTITLCLNPEGTYDLIASNGMEISNAIVNGEVIYPNGNAPYMLGNPALCCPAANDPSFTHILTNTTYYSYKVWDDKYYIADGVIVTVATGAVLDITNVDVVFGECAGIVFQQGSYLRANNSVFRPCYVDGTWKGLRFEGPGEFDNIINESTFKNAEVALYFQGGSDGVVSDNLFSNCNIGVMVENNNQFDHPISGNRFVTEQFFPDFACDSAYTFVTNASTIGINSISSRFLGQISQNQFINSWGTNVPMTFGINQRNGGGFFSENTFTDISYPLYLEAALFATNIENNDIEINRPALFTLSSIFVYLCKNPVIEINGNTIVDNVNQYNSMSAIYARSSDNLSIARNNIDGFRYGIINVAGRNAQITENEINNCELSGIYFLAIGNANDRNFITCNNIMMRNFNSSRGLFCINLSHASEVTSNCINDCFIGMDFRSSSVNNVLPLIRNNFLYNYNFSGIYVQGYSGNIGTAADPGMNTLYSNNNSAIDINSLSTINVADNFGMFNISWPQVQITSNNPYHSTASCAQQIYNMPSQGNLNTNLSCNHFRELLIPLTGVQGNFTLPENYSDQLKSASEPYRIAELILSSVSLPDENLLNELLAHEILTDNQKSMLQYAYWYRLGSYQLAGVYLASFLPKTEDETDYKMLRTYDLDVQNYGYESLSYEDVLQLEKIIDKRNVNSNLAISLFNNTGDYKNYQVEDIELPEAEKSDRIKHIGEGENYLNIYPNPAFDKAFVELVHNNGNPGTIKIIDAGGRIVTDYEISIVAGGIEMDIRNLEKGFYFVTLADPETGLVKTGKLVKVRD